MSKNHLFKKEEETLKSARQKTYIKSNILIEGNPQERERVQQEDQNFLPFIDIIY